MFDSTLPTSLTRYFAPWGSASSERWQQDQHGFLSPTSQAIRFNRLFEAPATLVVAQPWLGKTTFAKATAEYLRQNHGRLERPDLDFGDRYHLTLLETHLVGSPMEPSWWSNWSSGTNEPACWIVDALDEAARRDEALLSFLFDLLDNLKPEKRGQLRLILLGRGTELPEGVFNTLERIYGQRLQKVELLPLDRTNAESILAADSLERTLKLIKKCKLEQLAGYPAALEHMKRLPEGTEISDTEVWRGMLTKLLEEPNIWRSPRKQCEPEDRFSAAGHLAAALTFSGIDEILTEKDLSYSNGPTLDDLIPRQHSISRRAAREALRSSMFCRTPTGYRFVQRNVREWMCAFAVSGIGLTRLKLMLQTKDDGEPVLPPHFRDLAAFCKKTTSGELKHWIEEVADLLPSDAVPPSLQDAVAIIDRAS